MKVMIRAVKKMRSRKVNAHFEERTKSAVIARTNFGY